MRASETIDIYYMKDDENQITRINADSVYRSGLAQMATGRQ